MTNVFCIIAKRIGMVACVCAHRTEFEKFGIVIVFSTTANHFEMNNYVSIDNYKKHKHYEWQTCF